MGQQLGRLVVGAVLAMACTPPRRLPPDTPTLPVAAADIPLEHQHQTCVRFWPEARYRSYAYDHVVHLQSGCDRDASCSVSTNVSATVVVVTVTPGEHVEVLTLHGAETPDFTPAVDCSR